MITPPYSKMNETCLQEERAPWAHCMPHTRIMNNDAIVHSLHTCTLLRAANLA